MADFFSIKDHLAETLLYLLYYDSMKVLFSELLIGINSQLPTIAYALMSTHLQKVHDASSHRVIPFH